MIVLALIAALAGLVLTRATALRRVSFRGDIQPIFDTKCTSCHPIAYPYLDLRASRSYAQLVRVGSPLASAFERVVPGEPRLSYLLTHIPDPSRRHLMTTSERQLIARWITQGAKNN